MQGYSPPRECSSCATCACDRAAVSLSAASWLSDTMLGRRCAGALRLTPPASPLPPVPVAFSAAGDAARTGLCRWAAEERRRCTGPEGTKGGEAGGEGAASRALEPLLARGGGERGSGELGGA